MTDFWIVTDHPFVQHRSLNAAERESKLLADKTGKKFTVHRIKSQVYTSTDIIRDLRVRLAKYELVDATAIQPQAALIR